MDEIRDHIHSLVGEDKNEQSADVREAAEVAHQVLKEKRRRWKLGEDS